MDELNVHVSNQFNSLPNSSGQTPGKIKNFLFSPKIIFVILGIIVLVEVVYAVRSLSGSSPTPLPSGKSAGQVTTGGSISLTASKVSAKVNEIIPVSVMIDAGVYSLSGVDLIVSFDPKAIEVLPAGLIQGRIFSEYPLVLSEPALGLITISGVSNLDSSFTGKGLFATLNVKAKVPGKTALTVDFKKGTTTASNLVDVNTSKNILEIVNNLELEIQ